MANGWMGQLDAAAIVIAIGILTVFSAKREVRDPAAKTPVQYVTAFPGRGTLPRIILSEILVWVRRPGKAATYCIGVFAGWLVIIALIMTCR